MPSSFRAHVHAKWEDAVCAFTILVATRREKINASTIAELRQTARIAVRGLLPGCEIITIDLPPYGDGRLDDRWDAMSEAETAEPAPPREYGPMKPYKPRRK